MPKHQRCFAGHQVDKGVTDRGCSQVVLCKIPTSQFGNMYEVGLATYAHYMLEGLPKDPAGFLAPWQDRCFPLLSHIQRLGGCATSHWHYPLVHMLSYSSAHTKHHCKALCLITGCRAKSKHACEADRC